MGAWGRGGLALSSSLGAAGGVGPHSRDSAPRVSSKASILSHFSPTTARAAPEPLLSPEQTVGAASVRGRVAGKGSHGVAVLFLSYSTMSLLPISSETTR